MFETIKKAHCAEWQLSVILTLCAYSAACKPVPPAAQIVDPSELTEQETREAQQLSIAFTKRLGETADLRVVMNEMFVPDAAERYVAHEKRRGRQDYVVFLHGDRMTVKRSVLDRAPVEDWERLYVATDNLFTAGLINTVTKSDLDKSKPGTVYPAAVRALLNRNPLLRDLIERPTRQETLESVEDMRSAASTLEQAVAMMRPDLPAQIDLEEQVLQLGVREASKTRAVEPLDLDVARARLLTPKLEITPSELLGFAKGTRMISIATFSAHALLLTKVDGKLRIVWALKITG